MQIVINSDGVITAYAKVGKLNGGVDFVGDFPSDFLPDKYMWQRVEPVIGEDGDIIPPPSSIIIKGVVQENGEEGIIERETIEVEYGEIIPNPDYSPATAMPIVTSEERLSAMEDAVAEIIEIMMGGEENG